MIDVLPGLTTSETTPNNVAIDNEPFSQRWFCVGYFHLDRELLVITT